MKTPSGIEINIGQYINDRVWTLLCKAQDGQEFEIELNKDQDECLCCVTYGSMDREVTELEIKEVLTEWNL